MAKILETIAKEKKPLSKLVEELPVYYATKTKIECSDDLKDEVMNNIANEIKTTTDFELDTTDGVKILKEDGWVIIRPSGTEPIFRCFAESDSQEKADAMLQITVTRKNCSGQLCLTRNSCTVLSILLHPRT